MVGLLIILASLIWNSDSKCLDPEVLRSIGLVPLAEPIKLDHSNLCFELYKSHKTCVDQIHFGKFLSNLYNYVLFKDQAVINSIYDDLKETQKHYFQEQGTPHKIGETQLLDVTDSSEGVLFSKQKIIDLRNSIISQQESCLDSQVKLTLGTFCMLSSDRASDFVLSEDKRIKRALTHDGFESNAKLTLKVEKATSDYVFDQCLPILRGLCVSSQVQHSTDIHIKTSRIQMGRESGCQKEMFRCRNSIDCSLSLKR